MLTGLVLIKYGLLAWQNQMEQDEKSAHLVSSEQTYKMNVTHFNNNWRLCSLKKNFWSKETTDFIIQIRNSNRLPRQRSSDQNTTSKEGRKELRFNLQNTKIISGRLVSWGIKLKSFLLAWLSVLKSVCDEIPHQLCSDSSGEAASISPRNAWTTHLSSSSRPLAANTPPLRAPKLPWSHFYRIFLNLKKKKNKI